MAEEKEMSNHTGLVLRRASLLLTVLAAVIGATSPVQSAEKKPNIILILSDDFGYGDSGPYGGGPGRGMPTPSLDRLAAQGVHPARGLGN